MTDLEVLSAEIDHLIISLPLDKELQKKLGIHLESKNGEDCFDCQKENCLGCLVAYFERQKEVKKSILELVRIAKMTQIIRHSHTKEDSSFQSAIKEIEKSLLRMLMERILLQSPQQMKRNPKLLSILYDQDCQQISEELDRAAAIVKQTIREQQRIKKLLLS